MPNTRFRYYPFTLTAGESQRINAVGDYIFLLSNNGAEGTLETSFDDEANQITPVGLVLKNEIPFSKIVLKNNDTNDCAGVLIIGSGNIDYKALVISTALTVTNVAGGTLNVADENLFNQTAGLLDAGEELDQKTVGTSAVKLFDADTDRVGCVVNSDPTNTGKIYLGFTSDVASDKCIYVIEAGGGFSFSNYRGTVYAISDTAGQLVNGGSW